MRKIRTIFLPLLLLVGCANTPSTNVTASQTAYEGYYKAIEETTRYQEDSFYYDYDASMSSMPDGTYRFYITIDNPQIAMYDVAVLAVVDEMKFEETSSMMPSIGIFETNQYHLIPYQSNAENGYVKGLVLSGECDHRPITIEMLVEWYDRTHENQQREFIKFELDRGGIVREEEVEEEVQEEVEQEEDEDE